jgi:hypothetical protein
MKFLNFKKRMKKSQNKNHESYITSCKMPEISVRDARACVSESEMEQHWNGRERAT